MIHIENKIESNVGPCYLTDEALERLIARTESEAMIHPPKGFKGEIMERIELKKRRGRNRQMFSYSMKVIVATAAALGIVLIVPANIRSGERAETMESMDMEQYREQQSDGSFTFRLNTRMDEYCSQFNEKLNQLFGMEAY